MRLPILMYHNFSKESSKSNGLCTSLEKFEKQMHYLKKNNYTTLHFSELKSIKSIPRKSIIITFDDATENQIQALQILEKHQLKASLFIPFAYVDKTDSWNNGDEKIMNIEQIKSLNPVLFELGMHSFYHQKFGEISMEKILEDFELSSLFVKKNSLQVNPVIAYPYGNYPKNKMSFEKFKQLLQLKDIWFGLRIGNRTNSFPFKNKYLLKRIDIKGEDSFLTFKLKLIFGKLKLF